MRWRTNGEYHHDLDPSEQPRRPHAAAVRSDIEGLAALMAQLQTRQWDPWLMSDREWEEMSSQQRRAFLADLNQRRHDAHHFGPTYFRSEAIQRALDHAHTSYGAMTVRQQQTVVHPDDVEAWLEDRRLVTIVAADVDAPDVDRGTEPPPPPEHGPTPSWPPPLLLTVRINMEAPLDQVMTELRVLIGSLHPVATRRPRRQAGARPTRERYDASDLAQMITWYYARAAGTPLKVLAAEAAGGSADAVAAMQTKILRQLRWLRTQLGVA